MEILREMLQRKISRRELLVGAAAAGTAAFGLNAKRAQAEEATAVPAFLEVEVLTYHGIGARKLTSDLTARINSQSQPISAETFVKAFSGDVILPLGQRLFFLTLDDGLSSQYRAVLDATKNVLDATGIFIPATFFAITKFNNPDRPIKEISGDTPCYNDRVHSYMSRDQLIDLIGRGHWVDNHTVNHANLTALEVGARNSEVVTGQQRIQSLWELAGRDKPYHLFAYPYGAYNADQAAFLNSAGYDLAFSERRVTHHLSSDRLYLGRINMPA